ncbi:YifB family Mg chelatase-like AAA ATPase [Candidatus Saccharibacteria bacterium]|nr:YifB family Mg chelatase-like AAA ATPase [Candidatus Saccharibacteria bacterium]
MIAKIYSIVPSGFSGALIKVEGDKNHGLPTLNIVGMADKTVSEAKDRVRSAITNSGFSFPTDKITINLAPADLHKDGTFLDFPIALSILLLSGQLTPKDVKGRIFVGELSLEGTLRPVRGIINIVETAKKLGFKEIFLPAENLSQASLVQDLDLIGINSLSELLLILKHQTIPKSLNIVRKTKTDEPEHSLDDIKGQSLAKRALSIAIAGHHNILISGPPGAGKTLLAKTAASLLPEPSPEEQVTLTKLYSLISDNPEIIAHHPFRSPHHSASAVSILGGGSPIVPGEISLAHLGILFLDELPEYPRHILEALRQPLEDKKITITRSNSRVTFPADFMLVATMNPCPCGFYGDPSHPCTCKAAEIKRYQQKLSGPLLDRIDLQISVPKVPIDSLSLSSPKVAKISTKTSNTAKNLPTSTLRKDLKTDQTSEHKIVKNKIIEAINRQHFRYQNPCLYNSSLSSTEAVKYLKINPSAEALLRSAAKSLNLSARSFYKTFKVAGTIADFEGSPEILPKHISEALSYRLSQNLGPLITQGKSAKNS